MFVFAVQGLSPSSVVYAAVTGRYWPLLDEGHEAPLLITTYSTDPPHSSTRTMIMNNELERQIDQAFTYLPALSNLLRYEASNGSPICER
jgi:hypothetical protein